MNAPWAVTAEKISAAVQRIVEGAHPRKVVLFGSAARDPALARDLDLLVVLPGAVDDPRRESVRLRRLLRGLSMAVDLIVISEASLKVLADRPGLVYREALRTGRTLYDAA